MTKVNQQRIRNFIVLLIILFELFPNIIWAGSWKKTTLRTNIPVDDLFLTIYEISPDNNWLIFFPDIYKEMNFISINLGTGKEMPTIGYNDPFEKRKEFKWTIFWKSESEAVLHKRWRHEVSPNK